MVNSRHDSGWAWARRYLHLHFPPYPTCKIPLRQTRGHVLIQPHRKNEFVDFHHTRGKLGGTGMHTPCTLSSICQSMPVSATSRQTTMKRTTVFLEGQKWMAMFNSTEGPRISWN